MDNDLEYWEESLSKAHFIINEEHLKLLDELIADIKEAKLSEQDLIFILRSVDAEIVFDILNMLKAKNIITEKAQKNIDKQLVDIYEEDYVLDKKNKTFKKRISLKTDNNARPINAYEILAIFFKHSKNEKLLFGLDKTDDEFLSGVVADFKELKKPKKSSDIYKKQKESIGKVLNSLISEVKSLRKEI